MIVIIDGCIMQVTEAGRVLMKEKVKRRNVNPDQMGYV